MSATASLQLLKAHATVSRSWLLAQIATSKVCCTQSQRGERSETELVRWYDREDYAHCDVRSDDHCQRYQGILQHTRQKKIFRRC